MLKSDRTKNDIFGRAIFRTIANLILFVGAIDLYTREKIFSWDLLGGFLVIICALVLILFVENSYNKGEQDDRT